MTTLALFLHTNSTQSHAIAALERESLYGTWVLSADGLPTNRQGSAEIQQHKIDKESLVGICVSVPQRQIHTKTELDEFSKRLKAPNVSPIDLRNFLLMLVKIRLEVANNELDRLISLHGMLQMGSNKGVSKVEQEVIDGVFSRCEMPVITKQLLERELFALEVWKPGMSAEKALTMADQRK